MGLRGWCFQRLGPGEFRRLTEREVEDFFSGRHPLTPDPDGFVRLASLTVWVHGILLLAVDAAHFLKEPVSSEGLLNPDVHRASTFDHLRLLWSLDSERPAPGVVALTPRRKMKEHEAKTTWSPTPADMTWLEDHCRQRAAGRDVEWRRHSPRHKP